MANYEITFTAYQVVVVMDAESKEEAIEAADNEIFGGNWEVEKTECREITDEDDLDTSVRHASSVVH